MRVIYQTLPVQASFTDPRTRRTITGYASFRVYLVGPDEEFPALPTIKHARSQFRRLADLRADAGHGKPIVAKMPARSALRGVRHTRRMPPRQTSSHFDPFLKRNDPSEPQGTNLCAESVHHRLQRLPLP